MLAGRGATTPGSSGAFWAHAGHRSGGIGDAGAAAGTARAPAASSVLAPRARRRDTAVSEENVMMGLLTGCPVWRPFATTSTSLGPGAPPPYTPWDGAHHTFAPGDLDAVLLTHAHRDAAGDLARLAAG